MSGFIIGILLGFIMKRSRFCLAGNLRDAYLEKKSKGIYAFLSIILTTSLIYFTMTLLGIIPERPEQASFSLLAATIGGLMFGFGAILANGCVVSSLLKVGDGRLAGVMSLLSFAIVAAAATQGLLAPLVGSMQTTFVVNDQLFEVIPFPVLFVVIPAFLIVAYLIYKNWKKEKKAIQLPSQFSGIRHFLFEKKLDIRIAAIIIGLLAGSSFLFSYLTGRYGSMGITTPVVSWLNIFSQNVNELNWASFFVVGIIVGSFIYALGSLEFSFKGTDGKTLAKSTLGGAMMGFGAIAGQGCLVGNGIVGTAIFSLNAWINFAFILVGIWIGTYVFYVKPLQEIRIENKEENAYVN
ncbi:YeeE/YedE family protein [Tetragenococcus halophilus]|uniref:YeeE/YedE family protein n=1 Tax=Tetragenococcus halophilus TaxID=51669 RepID=UPI000B929C1B|nr:YeeE/YedE family protein [Tetragenococcus halophilus]